MNSTESIALALSFSASVKLLLLTLHAPRDSAATVPASSFLHAGGEVGGAAGGGPSNGISALIEAKAHGRRSTCLQAAGQLHCMMDGAVDVIGAPARHGAGMCRCCSDPSQYLANAKPAISRLLDARMPFANFVGKVAAKASHSRKRSRGYAPAIFSVSTPLLTV